MIIFILFYFQQDDDDPINNNIEKYTTFLNLLTILSTLSLVEIGSEYFVITSESEAI